MGTMLVTFHSAGQPGGGAESQPVIRLPKAKTERVATSAGSSAATTTTAAQGDSGKKTDGGFVTVRAVGVNLFLVCGASPTAVYPAAGEVKDGIPLMSGEWVTLAVNKGDKVAAIEFT